MLGSQCLASNPDVVELVALPDEGLRMILKVRPSEIWKLIGAMATCSIASLIVGVLIERLHLVEDFNGPFFRHAGTPFYSMSALFLGIGLFVLIMRVVAGPDQAAILEIHPRRLKVDRYVAGDHVVREYSASEVRAITIRNGVIEIATSPGEFGLGGNHLPLDVKVAMVAVIALGLWQESTCLLPNLRIGKFAREQLPLYAFDRSTVERGDESATRSPPAA